MASTARLRGAPPDTDAEIDVKVMSFSRSQIGALRKSIPGLPRQVLEANLDAIEMVSFNGPSTDFALIIADKVPHSAPKELPLTDGKTFPIAGRRMNNGFQPLLVDSDLLNMILLACFISANLCAEVFTDMNVGDLLTLYARKP